MEITLNDKIQIVKDNISLSEIVFSIVGDKQKGIAVAVNELVVSKSNWEKHVVQSNDKILIIKATQGG